MQSRPDAMIASTPTNAATASIIRKRAGVSSVNRNTHDSGKTVTMWKSAKLASGAKAPVRMTFHSDRTVSVSGAGSSDLSSNSAAYSGVTTMRSRAKSATTLIAKATKKG